MTPVIKIGWPWLPPPLLELDNDNPYAVIPKKDDGEEVKGGRSDGGPALD